MRKPNRIVPALFLLPVAGVFAQVTVPYTNDFTSSVADFSEVGSWTLDTTGGPLELTSGTEYTLSVDGTYSGNDLDLVLELSDGTNSDSVSGTIANFATSTAFGVATLAGAITLRRRRS